MYAELQIELRPHQKICVFRVNRPTQFFVRKGFFLVVCAICRALERPKNLFWVAYSNTQQVHLCTRV